jgi:hypothetical protein
MLILQANELRGGGGRRFGKAFFRRGIRVFQVKKINNKSALKYAGT